PAVRPRTARPAPPRRRIHAARRPTAPCAQGRSWGPMTDPSRRLRAAPSPASGVRRWTRTTLLGGALKPRVDLDAVAVAAAADGGAAISAAVRGRTQARPGCRRTDPCGPPTGRTRVPPILVPPPAAAGPRYRGAANAHIAPLREPPRAVGHHTPSVSPRRRRTRPTCRRPSRRTPGCAGRASARPTDAPGRSNTD